MGHADSLGCWKVEKFRRIAWLARLFFRFPSMNWSARLDLRRVNPVVAVTLIVEDET
jgi:hypothetical protein